MRSPGTRDEAGTGVVGRSKNASILLHDPTEPAGLIEGLFTARGIPTQVHRLDLMGTLPPGLGPGPIVLMGGPMSANDQDTYPWLAEEEALVRDAIRSGRPVLGICLGAQVIARALGARVYPSVPEIGWRTLAGVQNNPLFPPGFSAFEMHGETFDLPLGARLVATGFDVSHQAFVAGSALGLQFHLEATPAIIETWTADLPSEERGRYRSATEEHLPEARRLLDGVLHYLLRE